VRFAALDSWRGVCAVLVAVYHFNLRGHFYTLHVVRNGYLFVDFFFVLSGFVMAHTYGGRLQDLLAVRLFVLRRIGRIWPLHATLLAILAAGKLANLYASNDGSAELSTIVYTALTNALLIHAMGIHDRLTWNGVSWSIGVEFYTYLVFATVCIFSQRWIIMWSGAIAVVGLAAVAVFSPHYMHTMYDFGVPRCLYGFFVGVIAYYLWQRREEGRIFSMVLFSVLELAALVGTVLFVAKAGQGPLSLAAPIVFAFVVIVFSTESGAISRLLKCGPFVFLGERSYSIYMIHFLFVSAIWKVMYALAEHGIAESVKYRVGLELRDVWIIGDPLLMDVICAFYLAIVVCTAEVTYRFIENPGRHLFNRLAQSMQQRRSAEPGFAAP
jgi:peptidoglycan/LPS O-acetylase OafA/YrhL